MALLRDKQLTYESLAVRAQFTVFCIFILRSSSSSSSSSDILYLTEGLILNTFAQWRVGHLSLSVLIVCSIEILNRIDNKGI